MKIKRKRTSMCDVLINGTIKNKIRARPMLGKTRSGPELLRLRVCDLRAPMFPAISLNQYLGFCLRNQSSISQKPDLKISKKCRHWTGSITLSFKRWWHVALSRRKTSTPSSLASLAKAQVLLFYFSLVFNLSFRLIFFFKYVIDWTFIYIFIFFPKSSM